MTTKHLERGPDAAVGAASIWEGRIVAWLIATAVFLATLPILFGAFIAPPHTQFLGVAYNTVDFCNYLAWMRQMEDGGLLLRNLFTTEPQSHLQFNLMFWLMGRFAHVTHMPLPVVWHVVRVPAAIWVLVLAYRFFLLCVPNDRAARLIALGFTALGSGFGWITWRKWADLNLNGSPVDAWQPEAYTFLSLYTSTLFTVSLLFILGALYSMLLAERTGKARYAVIAGLCGAVLGDIHSYDVLHISAAWGLFLIVWTVVQFGRAVAGALGPARVAGGAFRYVVNRVKIGVAGTWLRTLIAGALMAPTVLYQYYIYKTNPVFQKRVAVETLSAPFWRYALGYGIPFVLAVILLAILAVKVVGRPRARKAMKSGLEENAPDGLAVPFYDGRTALFVICWAIAGLAVIYMHVPFQRKMLMGEHFPLCLLAGVAASILVRRLRLPARVTVAALLVLAAAPSTYFFLARDFHHLTQGTSETSQGPYIADGLIDACNWLSAHTAPDAAVIGFPEDCIYVPGGAGRAVWAGHWGETPDYKGKMYQFRVFVDSQTPDGSRPAFLRSTKAQYLLYPLHMSGGTIVDGNIRHEIISFGDSPRPYLTFQYSNANYVIFKINTGG